MSHDDIHHLERELLEKHELLRPGFVRISFPYFVKHEEVEYVLRAIEQVSKYGYRLLPHYRFNHKTGEVLHRKRFTKFPQRIWLEDIMNVDEENKHVVKKNKMKSFDELLEEALSIYSNANEKVGQIPSYAMVLSEDAEKLRWFVWPSEVKLSEMMEVKQETCTLGIIRPENYLKKDDESITRKEGKSDYDKIEGTALLYSSQKKFQRRTADTSAPTFSSGTLELTKPRAFCTKTSKSSSSSSPSKSKKTIPQQQQQATTNTTTSRKKKKNKIPKKIMSEVGRAVMEWGMIKEGDHLLLGLSGGKDSLTLLHVLLALQKRAPINFKISAATVDPQSASFKPAPLKEYVKSLGVNYHFLEEPIYSRAKSSLQGSSICAYCARMKRGMLYTCCRENGCNVLVLGQHLDDLAESFIMSAFNNGLIRTMSANYTIDAGDLRVIRPLVYVRESEMRKFSIQANLPVINENCPACFESPKERHRVKKLLEREASLNPSLFSNLKNALTPLMSAEACRGLRDAGKIRKESAKRATKVSKIRAERSKNHSQEDEKSCGSL